LIEHRNQETQDNAKEENRLNEVGAGVRDAVVGLLGRALQFDEHVRKEKKRKKERKKKVQKLEVMEKEKKKKKKKKKMKKKKRKKERMIKWNERRVEVERS